MRVKEQESDLPCRMEVCPYCKKPFKRLKSHLPHCKMLGPPVPTDQDVRQSKPRAKKVKGPIRDPIKAKERELGTDPQKRNPGLKGAKSEWTVKSSPLLAIDMKKASSAGAGKDIKDQIQPTLITLKNTEPEITLHEEGAAPFSASENTTHKKGLPEDLPNSGEGRNNPSATEASLFLGPVEPSLSNRDRKCSAFSNGVQTASANLRLDTIDAPRQNLLVKLGAVPVGDYYSSPTDLSPEVRRVSTSWPSKARVSKTGEHLSGVAADLGDTRTQNKNTEPRIAAFEVRPLGTVQVRENQGHGLHFRAEAQRSSGNAENCVFVTEIQHRAFVNDDPKKARNSGGGGPSVDLFMLKETACRELLSVSQSCNPSLVCLATKFLREGKTEACNPAGKAPAEREEQASLAPRSGCQPQALHPGGLCSTQPHASQSPLARKTLSSALGLEWFPELYPGYLGLGVLPGRPQRWSPVTQKPLLISPRGERLSQVPLLERSATAVRSLEPPTGLTTSSFSLVRILGAVQKGWIRCSTTVKSGVGGITMLFTGYFVLCCSWSFKHLKLQRWRK
uniref:Mitochondrial nucleoid associated protein 1 n=1 Tax=Catagonus wagneri TaxID=51154 RepID=A0A8C3WIW5_9CETA